MNIELQILSMLRVLFEVAGLFLIAQGALYVLAGAKREQNPIYQLCRIITRPAIRATRFLTPRLVGDRDGGEQDVGVLGQEVGGGVAGEEGLRAQDRGQRLAVGPHARDLEVFREAHRPRLGRRLLRALRRDQ